MRTSSGLCKYFRCQWAINGTSLCSPLNRQTNDIQHFEAVQWSSGPALGTCRLKIRLQSETWFSHDLYISQGFANTVKQPEKQSSSVMNVRCKNSNDNQCKIYEFEIKFKQMFSDKCTIVLPPSIIIRWQWVFKSCSPFTFVFSIQNKTI